MLFEKIIHFSHSLFSICISNHKFAEYYTNDLSAISAKELAGKVLEMSTEYWLPLFYMAREEPSTCVPTLEKKIYAGFSVFATLEQLIKRNAYPTSDESGFTPSNFEAIQTLEKLFEKLRTPGNGQRFALNGQQALDVYFEDGFVLPVEFKFLTDGSVQPDTNSILAFEQFLPFQNAHHSDNDCVPAEKLPLFYRNKGKK